MYNSNVIFLVLIDSTDPYYKYQFINRKKISSNSRFNIFFDHVIAPDKKEVKDFLIIKPKISLKDKVVGICILPLYKNKFCLMNGWRHQLNQFVLQAPAGFVESDEDPADTAIRELEEETMFSCEKSNLISLGTYLPDAGLIEGRVALFLAKDCIESEEVNQYEIGTSDISYFTKSQLINIISQENNIGGSTIVACYRSLRYLGFID